MSRACCNDVMGRWFVWHHWWRSALVLREWRWLRRRYDVIVKWRHTYWRRRAIATCCHICWWRCSDVTCFGWRQLLLLLVMMIARWCSGWGRRNCYVTSLLLGIVISLWPWTWIFNCWLVALTLTLMVMRVRCRGRRWRLVGFGWAAIAVSLRRLLAALPLHATVLKPDFDLHTATIRQNKLKFILK